LKNKLLEVLSVTRMLFGSQKSKPRLIGGSNYYSHVSFFNSLLHVSMDILVSFESFSLGGFFLVHSNFFGDLR
jgi:hypothetical protein